MLKNKKKLVYAYLLMTFSLWGSLYVVSKFVLNKIPVFTVSFIRYLIAVIFLFSIIHFKKTGKIQREDYKYIIIVGFMGYFVSLGVQLIGTKISGASMASLINSMNPVFITLAATVILKEKLTLKKAVSIILSLIGVYIIVGGNVEGQTAGIFLSLGSVVLWSVVSVYVRKISQKYPPLLITAYGMLVAVVCNFPVSVCEIITGQAVSFDKSAVFALVYMGIFCTGIAHLLWNQSLSMMEAGVCSAFYPIQPLVSVVLGIIFLHEKITVSFLVGCIFIVCGVLLCILRIDLRCTEKCGNKC